MKLRYKYYNRNSEHFTPLLQVLTVLFSFHEQVLLDSWDIFASKSTRWFYLD